MNLDSIGNIFPKPDFKINLIYTYYRGENSDRKNRVFRKIKKVQK